MHIGLPHAERRYYTDYHELFFPHFFPCSSEQDMTLGIGAYHPECCLLLVRRAGGADSPGPRMKCTTPGMAAHYRACVCGAFGRWPGSGMAGEAWGRACRNTGPLGGSRLLHSSQSTGVYETFQDTSLRQNRVPPLLNPSPFVNHLTMALVLRSFNQNVFTGKKINKTTLNNFPIFLPYKQNIFSVSMPAFNPSQEQHLVYKISLQGAVNSYFS